MVNVFLALGIVLIAAAQFLLPWLLRRVAGKRVTYREYLFRPLVPGELAMLTREHVDTHTPELTSLGYGPLGDFLQQKKPLWQVERLFLHADGRSFAGLVQCRDMRCVSFLSILADGTYLESCNIDPPEQEPEDEVPFRIQCVRGASVRELCALHKLELARREPENGPAMIFGPEHLRDVIEYGRRLAHQDLYAKGMSPQPPPEAVVPSGIVPGGSVPAEGDFARTSFASS